LPRPDLRLVHDKRRLYVSRANDLFDWEFKMSVARVTEISSSSKKGFQDAIEKGIARAAKTLKNVEGAWIQEQKVVVEDGAIVAYRVNMKVTFILTD
jgi:flavin-binding protein dodecin